MNCPSLQIVATPIGNIEDISERARKTLAAADLILAEDTRRAARLLNVLNIQPKNIISFFEHNEEARQPEIMAALAQGGKVALISDAGTPLMADPGYRLVRACREKGVKVTPIPGPSAPIAALSASGLPPLPFSFLGFMPKMDSSRRTLLIKFASVPGSLIFFERKNRLRSTLEIAHRILGGRDVAICRELTKEYEEFITGNLADLSFLPSTMLGEITVIIAPAHEPDRMPREEVILQIDAAIDEGLKPRVAAKLISEKCQGWSSDEIYAIMEKIKKQAADGE